MPNPDIVVIDSDVLVQVFLTKSTGVLSHLKSAFGVQPAVTIEVDNELRWISRYQDRFEPALDKALRHETIVQLDQARFQRQLASAHPGASWSEFQTLGQQYGARVDLGEAYTHAAGLTLQVPTVSNDFRALEVLQANGLATPAPVLRTFDLLVFALETGYLDIRACERIRSELLAAREGIPKTFTNRSFADGLVGFHPRIRAIPLGATSGTPRGFAGILEVQSVLPCTATRSSGPPRSPSGGSATSG